MLLTLNQSPCVGKNALPCLVVKVAITPEPPIATTSVLSSLALIHIRLHELLAICTAVPAVPTVVVPLPTASCPTISTTDPEPNVLFTNNLLVVGSASIITGVLFVLLFATQPGILLSSRGVDAKLFLP